MPVYSFICNTCNHQVDKHLDIDQRDILINCPSCVTGQLIRTITAAPVHFKGTGFYKTGG
jgi:putative FmdB family regulatory protein